MVLFKLKFLGAVEQIGMEKITSRSNNLIKHTKKLFTSHKERALSSQFALEGARLCFDAFHSECGADLLLLTEDAARKYPEKCTQLIDGFEKTVWITGELASYLSETKNPQGVFVVCSPRKNVFYPEKGKKYIALDQIQDPSNLGAVIRTAEALGIDGALLSGCCDLYNPKVLRASMGGAMRLPVLLCEDLALEITNLRAQGFHAYASVPDRSAENIKHIAFNGSDICVIGNEGNGVSQAVKQACTGLLTIHMLGRAESLNASVAAAIIMWEMLS